MFSKKHLVVILAASFIAAPASTTAATQADKSGGVVYKKGHKKTLCKTKKCKSRACKARKCKLRVYGKKCTQRNPGPCIRLAIIKYKLLPWQAHWMWRIARCESGLNAYAKNPHSDATGLYQFMPGTFRAFGGRGDIYNCREQARVAAWAVKNGKASHWECK